MNARSLTATALKIWGAILIVGALGSLPSAAVLGALSPPADIATAVFRATQVGLLLNLFAQTLLGVGMVAFAERVVGWVVPDGLPLKIDVYASELSALGFALVGLFVLIQGAEEIVATVYTLSTKPLLPTSDPTFWYVWEPERQAIVKGLVQIVAGVVLMFGREAIVNAWWRLRSFGKTAAPLGS